MIAQNWSDWKMDRRVGKVVEKTSIDLPPGIALKGFGGCK